MSQNFTNRNHPASAVPEQLRDHRAGAMSLMALNPPPGPVVYRL
jgi:hypothetical protein